MKKVIFGQKYINILNGAYMYHGCSLIKCLAVALWLSQVQVSMAADPKANGEKSNRFSGSVLLEFGSYRPNRNARKSIYKNSTMLDAEINGEFRLNKNFSVGSTFMIRPFVKDRKRYWENVRTDDLYSRSMLRRAHDQYGIGIAELYVKFQAEDASVKVGKINPEFGMAWNKLRPHGVFENYLTEEYRILNKVGASVSALFRGAEASAAVFFEDNSILSEPAFASSEKNSTNYGGAGNTGKPDSFAVSVKGLNFLGQKGLAYNVGFTRLATDKSNESREKGYVFGLEQEFKMGIDSSVIVFSEIAYFENFGGKKLRGINRLNDAIFYTVAVSGLYSNWFANASITQKDNSLSARGDDRVMQLSVGYSFKGVKLSVSRANIVEHRYVGKPEYQKHDIMATGITLSYQMEF